MSGSLTVLPGALAVLALGLLAGPVTAVFETVDGLPWTAIGIGASVLAVGAGGYVLVRRREAEPVRAAGPYPEVSTEELTAQAGEGLLAVDEAVRTSQLDLDFARLQYGEFVVGPFAATLAQARSEMQQAFTLRQQLDDEISEDEPTRRRMLASLLELVQAADDRLDARAADFATLRDLAANASQLLDGLASRVTALAGRLPAEEQRLEQLRRRWAPGAVAPVEQAVPEARVQIAAADQAITAGRAELTRGSSGAAVPFIRTAQTAVAVAQTTLDSIGARARELETAATAVPAARAEVQAGISAGQTVDPSDAAAVAGPMAQAQEALAVAGQLVGGPTPDPVEALARLDAADDALDDALAGAQQAVIARRDAAARADRAVTSARHAVISASAAVAASRDVAGAAPRTRLSEAERQLAAAEAALPGDPAGALDDANRANSLARAVQTLIADARRDREWSWEHSHRSGGGGFFGGSAVGWSAGRSYRSSSRSSRRSSSRRSSSSRLSSSSSQRSGRSSGGRHSGGGRF